MRKLFQTLLLLAAFVPFVLGGMTLLSGAGRFFPPELVTGQLDGQVRFWGVRSMLPFVLAVWIVLNFERAGTVLSIVVIATAIGGIARLGAVPQFGWPDPALMGVIVFEIAALAFLPWYWALPRHRREPAGHA